MRNGSFGKVLDGIVSLVLASAVGTVGASGCGGVTTSGAGQGSPTDGGTDAGFDDDTAFTCVSPLTDVLTNLRPTAPVDYLELRSQTFDNPSASRPPGDPVDGGPVDAGPAPTIVKTVSTNGQACSTATKRDACLALVAAAKVATLSEGWQPHSDGGNRIVPATLDSSFLIYTRGDEVGVLHSTAELAKFLGVVDTFEEARLLLISQGYTLVCSEQPKTGWKENAFDGSWDIIVNGDTCQGIKRYRYRISADGTVTRVGVERYDNGVACGRRPEGFVDEARGFAVGLGAYFADVAHLEAASVVSFRRLEVELRRLGAPEELVRRARRARTDEIRHARQTSALARRFGGGGATRALSVAPMIERDLIAIAIENATEGCVRETYGALVASFQARTAGDPEVRAVFTRIARDEARHAELSHDVALWLDTKLDATSRARVARERARALADLHGAIEQAPAQGVIEGAGLPTVSAARALLDRLEHALLAA